MGDLVHEALWLATAAPAEWAQLPAGEMVRRLRRRFGLKQAELAARAGLPPSVVCRAEQGADIRLATLKRLFAGAGCAPLILLIGGLDRLERRDLALEAAWRERELERERRREDLRRRPAGPAPRFFLDV